mgnify:CR=1
LAPSLEGGCQGFKGPIPPPFLISHKELYTNIVNRYYILISVKFLILRIYKTQIIVF